MKGEKEAAKIHLDLFQLLIFFSSVGEDIKSRLGARDPGGASERVRISRLRSAAPNGPDLDSAKFPGLW